MRGLSVTACLVLAAAGTGQAQIGGLRGARMTSVDVLPGASLLSEEDNDQAAALRAYELHKEMFNRRRLHFSQAHAAATVEGGSPVAGKDAVAAEQDAREEAQRSERAVLTGDRVVRLQDMLHAHHGSRFETLDVQKAQAAKEAVLSEQQQRMDLERRERVVGSSTVLKLQDLVALLGDELGENHHP